MTAPGRYATNDGSFARSTGNAAARGSSLIAVAVVIGLLLLWKGGVGGDVGASAIQDDSLSTDTSSADDSSTDTGDASGSTDEGTGSDDGAADDDSLAVDDVSTDDVTDPTPVTPTARPVGEVKVMVANGAGESGLAGTQSGVLTTAGYVAVAVNAAVATDISTVWYIDGYDADAIGVAEALGGSEIHLRLAGADPVALVREGEAIGNEDAHVWVVLGSDRALG
jgi:hypothetical protein